MGYYHTESYIGVYGENIFFGASSIGYDYSGQTSNFKYLDFRMELLLVCINYLIFYSGPREFTTVDNGVFFIANDGNYGYEIAFSDGEHF